MNIDTFKSVVVPTAMEALEHAEVLEETERRSPVRKATIVVEGISFTVLEQNRKKASRFALAAKAGHKVAWIVRDSDSEWFLTVDGTWIQKSQVGPNGEVAANA